MFQYIIEVFNREFLFGYELWKIILISLILLFYIILQLDKESIIDLNDWIDKIHSMKITKREFIASIAIIGIMLIIGFGISGKIREGNLEKQEEYNQALKIDNDSELLGYGIRTNVGNAFIYGDVIATDPVVHNEISYGSLTRVRERYTMHTRIVTYTDGNGHTRTRTEVYWTWDEVDREKKNSSTLNIVGSEFPWVVLGSLPETYLETVDISATLRDKYYVSNIKNTGTLYGNLGNIENEYGAKFSKFYVDEEINEVVDRLNKEYNIIWFWIGWALLGCVIIMLFYYGENRWLE